MTLRPVVPMSSPLRLVALCCLLMSTACLSADAPEPLAKDGNSTTNSGTTNTKYNLPPVAAPGRSRTVFVNEPVQLDGSESYDVEGQPITYQWRIERPEGSQATLSGELTALASFAPDVPGDFVITLTVSDGQVEGTSSMTVTALQSGPDPITNSAPVADAGIDRQVEQGSTVMLDAQGSTDPENDELAYQWRLLSWPPGSRVSLDDDTLQAPSFVADLLGEYRVQLVVRDLEQSSPPAEVVITAVEGPPANQPPVARTVLPSGAITVGVPVELKGSASQDPEGKALTYLWSMTAPAGSQASPQDPTASITQFTPDVEGTYSVTLTVNDGELQSIPNTITLTTSVQNTPPIARTSGNLYGIANQVVELDGTPSSDKDLDTLTYQWTLTPPQGSQTTLANPQGARPSFVPDVPGIYQASLTVNDGKVDSALAAQVVEVVTPCLIVSEYIEGASFDKAVELFNCSDGKLPLNSIGVCLISNQSTTCSQTLTFGPTTLDRGKTFVLCDPNASNSTLTSSCAKRTATMGFNGDDRILVFQDRNRNGAFDESSDAILDAFGDPKTVPQTKLWENVAYRRCDPRPYIPQPSRAFRAEDRYRSFSPDDFTNMGIGPTTTACQ